MTASDTIPDQSGTGAAKRPVGRPRKAGSKAPSDRKPRAPKPTAPPQGSKPTGRPSNDRRARDSVERAVSLVGLLLAMVNEADGSIVIEAAPALAEQVVEVAKKHPKVYAMLVDTSKATPYLGAATVLGLGIALPIAANHGVSILDRLPPMARLMLEGLRARVIVVEDKPDTVEVEVEAPAPDLAPVTPLFPATPPLEASTAVG